MREIKFRCWDKKNEAMVTVWGINWLDFTNQKVESVFAVNPVIKGEYLLKHEDAEIMQFTGLRDKNGVEIYEGDIVEFHYNCYVNGYKTRIQRKMLVEWNDCGFYITDDSGRILIKTMISLSFIGFGDPSIEVVGNRFQHPELLNAK